MGKRIRHLAASLIVVGSLAACEFTADHVHASPNVPASKSHKLNGPNAKWNWYELTQGNDHIDSIKIKAACISAEDSAAHLKLIGYGNGTAVYGCFASGY